MQTSRRLSVLALVNIKLTLEVHNSNNNNNNDIMLTVSSRQLFIFQCAFFRHTFIIWNLPNI